MSLDTQFDPCRTSYCAVALAKTAGGGQSLRRRTTVGAVSDFELLCRTADVESGPVTERSTSWVENALLSRYASWPGSILFTNPFCLLTFLEFVLLPEADASQNEARKGDQARPKEKWGHSSPFLQRDGGKDKDHPGQPAGPATEPQSVPEIGIHQKRTERSNQKDAVPRSARTALSASI